MQYAELENYLKIYLNLKNSMDDVKIITEENISKISNGIYPFISKHKIVVLRKGIYHKLNSENRFAKVNESGDLELVEGFYYVSDNIINIPPNLEITEAKQRFIDKHIDLGYKINFGFPKLVSPYLQKGSEEYNIVMN